MDYRIRDIASALGVTYPLPRPEARVRVLLTDSRSLASAADSLFFALRTATGDGHRYLGDLYAKGVRNFVVDRTARVSLPADANLLPVADTTAALQRLATAHRNLFAATPVIGITGSRGKTTVKEWLYALLKDDFRIARSPRSYNSRIGVPLSLWEMDAETELAIFEAGVSRIGEMGALARMIRPTLAVITNIGEEHDEGFTSRRAKAQEKVRLAAGADCIIYDGDDRVIADVVAGACVGAKEIAWSRTDADRPLYISSVAPTPDGNATEIKFNYLMTPGSVTIPFTAEADIENAIHCIAVMLYLNRPIDTVRERMGRLTPVGTRLEVIEGENGCLIVSDSYTSDFHSLAPALDFMQRRATGSRTMNVILIDVMHETSGAATLYEDVARLLRLRGVGRVIGIGREISAHSGVFDGDARFFLTTDEFLNAVTADDFNHELILIKGASGFRFDRITERLEGRQHETVLEVNLDAMVRNYNFFRSRLRPETGIVCMVKAFGYGAGSYELAKTLQSQGAAYLAVAAHDEGADLRRAGITMPIMVLNPKVVDYGALFDHKLEPEIYSMELLRAIIDEAARRGERDYPVHIKLDTGMHRLGFLEEELPEVARMIGAQQGVAIKSVFSHLCAADDPADDDYTRSQFATFNRCCDYLRSRFPGRKILSHILNSAGIIRFPQEQHDMVRLGIGLYGIRTLTDGSEAQLERVSSLHSVIISIREWPAGTTIGYNRRGILHRRSRIATVPVGYADGIDRRLGYGNLSVDVNGHACPTVGSICMDLMMIDVTEVECRTGDRVEIFGDAVPTEDVADSLDTIPYEILTSVSARVKRVYFRE